MPMVFSKIKGLSIVPFFTLKLPWPEYFMVVKSIFDIKCFKDVKFGVKQYIFSTNRSSQDPTTNKQGEVLLGLCKSKNMFILNGRCDKDKNIGKFTFRDTSVIDYVICSPDCLGKVKSFEITDLDTLFADGHSLLSIVISLPKPIPKITHARSNNPHKRWDESKKAIFIQNINRQEVETTQNHHDMQRQFCAWRARVVAGLCLCAFRSNRCCS